jgi:hypothetical protein
MSAKNSLSYEDNVLSDLSLAQIARSLRPLSGCRSQLCLNEGRRIAKGTEHEQAT